MRTRGKISYAARALPLHISTGRHTAHSSQPVRTRAGGRTAGASLARSAASQVPLAPSMIHLRHSVGPVHSQHSGVFSRRPSRTSAPPHVYWVMTLMSMICSMPHADWTMRKNSFSSLSRVRILPESSEAPGGAGFITSGSLRSERVSPEAVRMVTKPSSSTSLRTAPCGTHVAASVRPRHHGGTAHTRRPSPHPRRPSPHRR